MAKNGPEWADYSMRYNSGTYNNQYMVIDTKLFQKGLPVMDNLLLRKAAFYEYLIIGIWSSHKFVHLLSKLFSPNSVK